MRNKEKIQSILINALQYLYFLRDNQKDESAYDYNCLVIVAETAMRELGIVDTIANSHWNGKSLISSYMALVKTIDLNSMRNRIFDIDDLCLIGKQVRFNRKYLIASDEFDT